MIAWVLAFSLIPVLGFGTVIYVMGIHIVESEVHRASKVAILQVKQQADHVLNQIEQFSIQFSMQSNVTELINIGESPSLGSLQLTNYVQKDLSTFVISTRLLDSAYLYHTAQEVMVTSQTIVGLHNKMEFRDDGWLPLLTDAAERKRQSFWIDPRLLPSFGNEPKKVISYVRILPNLYSEMKAALVVNVDANIWNGMIKSYPFETSGSILVFNKEGVLISQTGEPPLIPEETERVFRSYGDAGMPNQATRLKLEYADFFATFIRSDYNGWTYAMLIPADKPTKNVELLKNWILLTTLAVSLLALVTGYASLNQFQSGIQRMMDRFFKNFRSESERPAKIWGLAYQDNLKRMESRLENFIVEVDEIRIQWQEQLPLLRDHYLYSALMGNTASLEKHIKHGKPLTLFDKPNFCVVIVEMDTLGEKARFRAKDEELFLFAAANICNELMKDIHAVETLMTRQHVHIIFNLGPAVTEQEMLEAAGLIRVSVKKFLKHSVTIAVGRIVSAFHGISVSYVDAFQSLQMNWLKAGDEVLTYPHKFLNPSVVRYPVEEESAIIALIKSGEEERAKEELKRFGRRLGAEGATFSLMRTYYLQLLVSIIRVTQAFDKETERVFPERNLYTEFMALDRQETMQVWFGDRMIRPLIQYLEQLNKRTSQEMIRKAAEMIETHYAQDLSLQWVADRLEISHSYLSRLFKEEMGENFVSYATRVRVERIKQLLVTTDLNMADIAEEVGYRNAPQLIRVFKKAMVVTPGEYRSRNEDKK